MHGEVSHCHYKYDNGIFKKGKGTINGQNFWMRVKIDQRKEFIWFDGISYRMDGDGAVQR